MASLAGLESVVLKVLIDSAFLDFVCLVNLRAVLEKGDFLSSLRPESVQADGFLSMVGLVGVWYLGVSKSMFYFWSICGS